MARTLDNINNEPEKKRICNVRIMTQEQGRFTPLIFTALGTTEK